MAGNQRGGGDSILRKQRWLLVLWEGASSSTVWGQVLGAESQQLGRKRPGSLREGFRGASHSQTLPRALITPSMEGLCDSNHTNPPGVWHCPQGTEDNLELQVPLLESCGVRMGAVLPETHTGTAGPGLQGEPLVALRSSVGFPQVLWVLESYPYPILITPTRVLSLDSHSFLSLWPDLVSSSLCLTSSIWPPDGRLGLLLQPAAPAREEGAPQRSPPS